MSSTGNITVDETFAAVGVKNKALYSETVIYTSGLNLGGIVIISATGLGLDVTGRTNLRSASILSGSITVGQLSAESLNVVNTLSITNEAVTTLSASTINVAGTITVNSGIDFQNSAILNNPDTTPSYAELFEHNDSGTTITVLSSGEFYQWVSSSAGLETGTSTASTSTGNDSIIIGDDGAGVYSVSLHVDASGTANATMEASIFHNNVEQLQITIQRRISGGGDVGASAATGYISASAGDTIDMRVSSDDNGDSINVMHVNIDAYRIGSF